MIRSVNLKETANKEFLCRHCTTDVIFILESAPHIFIGSVNGFQPVAIQAPYPYRLFGSDLQIRQIIITENREGGTELSVIRKDLNGATVHDQSQLYGIQLQAERNPNRFHVNTVRFQIELHGLTENFDFHIAFKRCF